MALLELKGLKKVYDQGKIEVPALRGVDLTVEKGEFTTIFGPSGSGKTTLLNLVGCLDTPTAGTILFDGQSLAELDKKELAMIRRHHIGFIFQSYNLIKTLAESQIPEVRRLYDELYRLSRAAYRVNEANKKKNAADKFTAITVSSQNSSILYQGEFTAQKGDNLLRINVEGNSGPVRITDLYYDG